MLMLCCVGWLSSRLLLLNTGMNGLVLLLLGLTLLVLELLHLLLLLMDTFILPEKMEDGWEELCGHGITLFTTDASWLDAICRTWYGLLVRLL